MVSTTGGGSEAARYLGKRCKADKDCGEDGKCLVEGEDSPLFLGGPAGGYCTKACSEDTDCEGSGSVCVRVSENGNEKQCVLGCTPEDVELEYLNDPLDPYKCQGRDDLSCFQDQFGGGVCLPNCGSDAQCEGDRVCDPRMGVCTSDPTTGLARGSACSYDPNAEEEDSEFPACEGTCIGLVQDEKDIVHGVCSELCTLGGDIMNDCGGLDKGLCLPLYRTASAGDIGMCVIACNAHDDCVMPLTFCYDFGNEDNGYCVDGAEECEDDDSECPRGTVCTETPDGRFCLDDTYPLTAPSSGTGGEGAGGSGTGGDGTGGSGTGGDGTGGSGTGGSGTGGSGTGGSGTGGSGTEAVSGAGGSEAVSGAGGGGAGG